MLEIVIATHNPYKLRELKDLLLVPGIRWRSLSENSDIPSPAETGRTFDANAIKKARAIARATGSLSLADDSGLAVDSLNERPGVKSARFAGAHGGDDANNAKLLRLLRRCPLGQRRARYLCTLALASPSRLLAVTRGRWEGKIALRPAGYRGFGYDPIFFVPRFGKTVGQLSARVKQQYSHRAMAARRLRPVLVRLVRRCVR